TYVKAAGVWSRPRLPRMDCVIVRHGGGDLVATEPRKVCKGQAVAVGTEEDGSQGIFVHAEGFLGGSHSANEFGFMQTEVSRERPVDYAVLAQLLGEERQRGGKVVWVVGPALVHARARSATTGRSRKCSPIRSPRKTRCGSSRRRRPSPSSSPPRCMRSRSGTCSPPSWTRPRPTTCDLSPRSASIRRSSW